jgi:hypothetical protein
VLLPLPPLLLLLLLLVLLLPAAPNKYCSLQQMSRRMKRHCDHRQGRTCMH